MTRGKRGQPVALKHDRLFEVVCRRNQPWTQCAVPPSAPTDGAQAGKAAVDAHIVECDALDGEAPFERGARLGAIQLADALSRGDGLG